MGTLWSERGSVQAPFVAYAQAAGWIYIEPDQAAVLRHGTTGLILHDIFCDQMQRMNPGVIDRDQAEQVARNLSTLRPTIEGNLDAWEWLRGVKKVFDRIEKRDRNVTLLDPNPARNVFQVTDELTFDRGVPPRIRLDVCLFINGIPVILVEAKAARLKQGIAEAVDQVRGYQRDAPELLALIQLFTVTHLVSFYYGATWNVSRKGLFNWRDEGVGESFEELVKSFLQPARVLRSITDYLLFTRVDGELSKVVLRPHQMRATEKAVERAADATKRRGLIWHTQGSGKTYTMITVAKQLVEDRSFQNPTVLMLVDRNELEEQLFSNLASVGFQREEMEARTIDHLRELLASDRRGIIVSTIHKFERMPAAMNTRSNIVVLVDEAHRSTSGDLGNYLVGALPNATFIGFTGTPVDRTAHGKGTFKVFGQDDEQGYLDKYSIRESIQDGTTVPLHYALAPNEMLVDRETLDSEFLGSAEAEGISDVEDLNRVLERAVNLRNMLKAPRRLEQIATYVAKHFKETVEPMGYKALLVAVDREACALYKAELDRQLPREASDVIISAAQHDGPVLRQYHYDEQHEEAVRKAFRKPTERPQILIVTDKLLTGFDAPILYCMYLDKPMRDHVLLQAIARVNRPYEDSDGRRKPAGFVLDFVGIFEKLESALAFDSMDVSGVIQGMDVLQESFARQIAVAREKYFPITEGRVGDKRTEAVIEAFRGEQPRQTFYRFFEGVQETYEILSPDVFIRPYLDDYGRLVEMYEICRSSYDRGIDIDRTFLRKTGQLVREHTFSGGVDEPKQTFELNEDFLSRYAKDSAPPAVKVINLLKQISNLVQRSSQEQPFLVSIGERAEEIAEAFEQRQVDSGHAMQMLLDLSAEAVGAKAAQRATGLSSEAFAVYWYLKGRGLADSEAHDVARGASQAFQEHPYWRSSADQMREIRLALYKVLIAAGHQDQSTEFVKQLLDQLGRAG